MQSDLPQSDLQSTNQSEIIETAAPEGFIDIADIEGNEYVVGLNLDVTPEQAERRLLLEADYLAQAERDNTTQGAQIYLMRLLANPKAREDFIRPLIRSPKDLPLERFGYLALARINLFFVSAAMRSFAGRQTTAEETLNQEVEEMKQTVTELRGLLEKRIISEKSS